MTLKELRLNCGLTQRKLAWKLGIKRNTISQWETGARQPSREMADALAYELNVTREEIERAIRRCA